MRAPPRADDLSVPTRQQVRRARQLRQEMPGVEARLWSYLRRRQLGGHKFRRQAPIGPFVADFVCLAARLVVEIDGPAHDARWERDERRDRWFHAEGYRVLRFSADDVFWQCEQVLEAIHSSLTDAPPPPLRVGTSPPSGEEA